MTSDGGVIMVDFTDEEKKKTCSDLFERISHFDNEVEELLRLSNRCTDPYVAQVVCERYDSLKGAYERIKQELQEQRWLCEASSQDVKQLQMAASKLQDSFEKCQLIRLRDRFQEER